MTYSTIRLEREGPVAILTLDRPKALNALSTQLAKELFEATIEIDEDATLRCLVITGAGGAFCAGGDVKEFVENSSRIGAHLKELTTYAHAAVARLSRAHLPVIAAVNGVAAGAGLGLSLSSDIVIAAESARFLSAYARIGASPDAGATYFLPRLVGIRRAAELLLTDRTLTAAEALAWGIVTKVVPDSELRAVALGLGRTLAQGPTEAYAATKRLLRLGEAGGLETQLQREADAISSLGDTAGFRAGLAAIMEKTRQR